MEVTADLTAEVNEFAAVKAAISKLTEREDELKALFVASGERKIVGDLHKVSVSWVCPKPTTDYRGVCDYLKVGPGTLALFTEDRDPYPTVKLYGR